MEVVVVEEAGVVVVICCGGGSSNDIVLYIMLWLFSISFFYFLNNSFAMFIHNIISLSLSRTPLCRPPHTIYDHEAQPKTKIMSTTQQNSDQVKLFNVQLLVLHYSMLGPVRTRACGCGGHVEGGDGERVCTWRG